MFTSNNTSISDLRALILVGGYGTRLRPLTFTKPKPLIEFANKPIVLHQIEALANAGVSQVILAVSYKAEDLEKKLTEEAEKMGVTLIFSHETQPLGTAGPLALARRFLDGAKHFIVMNSDVICEFPFNDLYKYHHIHGKEGTMFVTKVDNPSKYGVVLYKENGQIYSFIEKPHEFISNKINAGIYIFKHSVLKRLELRMMSLEKDVFPSMAKEGQLYAIELQGFWMDIGQPKDFLEGTFLYLSSLKQNQSNKLLQGDNKDYIIKGNVLVDSTAKIGKGCRIGPDVTIGPNVNIEDGACIKKCVILEGAHISKNTWMENCIIGWRSIVGSWVRMENTTVGEECVIKDELYLNGGQIMPNKCITMSAFEPQINM